MRLMKKAWQLSRMSANRFLIFNKHKMNNKMAKFFKKIFKIQKFNKLTQKNIKMPKTPRIHFNFHNLIKFHKFKMNNRIMSLYINSMTIQNYLFIQMSLKQLFL